MSDSAEAPTDERDPVEGMSAPEDALARARANARARGYRPGRLGSRGDAVAGLTQRRGGSGRSESTGDPQAVGDEVTRLLDQRGWVSDVQVGSVVGRWPSIVGEHVASHVVPVSFEGTVLTVRAESTSWATQMQLLKNSVLARIEAQAGPDVVTEVVVHGPTGPSWRKGPLRASGPGPRDTYG